MDYKVQRGDTLSALAKRHGTTVDAIMDANKGAIVDRDKIYTGDTITIPGTAKAAAEAVQPEAPKPDPAPQVDAEAGAAEVATATPPAPSMYEQPTAQVVYEVYASPVAPQPATTQVMGARSDDDVRVVEVRPTATASYEDHAYEQRVVELVNQIRGQYGLPTLAYDARLDQGAEGHTAHQATVGRMAHEGIGDGTPQDRMLAAGWNWAWGENAAVGQTSPEQVVAEWMASPGHRANILNGDFRFLSVGYDTAADGRPYWTQSFGIGS